MLLLLLSLCCVVALVFSLPVLVLLLFGRAPRQRQKLCQRFVTLKWYLTKPDSSQIALQGGVNPRLSLEAATPERKQNRFRSKL